MNKYSKGYMEIKRKHEYLLECSICPVGKERVGVFGTDLCVEHFNQNLLLKQHYGDTCIKKS